MRHCNAYHHSKKVYSKSLWCLVLKTFFTDAAAKISWVPKFCPIFASYGSFTLAMLFWQKRWRQRQSMFLPWPPWETRQKIETILSYVPPPKIAKASIVLCHCYWRYRAYFANGNKNKAFRRTHNAATLLRCGSRLVWNIRLRWECLAFSRPGCEILIEKVFCSLNLEKHFVVALIFWFLLFADLKRFEIEFKFDKNVRNWKSGTNASKLFPPVIVAQSK